MSNAAFCELHTKNSRRRATASSKITSFRLPVVQGNLIHLLFTTFSPSCSLRGRRGSACGPDDRRPPIPVAHRLCTMIDSDTAMADIVLSTLNAKYIHAAFGLRYLMANLGQLQSRACLVEFDINHRPLDVVEVLLARQPRIVGLGVYIWNVAQTTEVIRTLNGSRPATPFLLGGRKSSLKLSNKHIVPRAVSLIP